MRILIYGIIGAFLGTLGHEVYHWYSVDNPRLIFTGYGVGIVSKNPSGEFWGYFITITVFIAFLLYGIRRQIEIK